MNKIDIEKLRKLGLLGAGIGCTIGAVLTGIATTPKVIDKLKEQKEEVNTKNLFKIGWKNYIPTMLFTIGAIACPIINNNINNRIIDELLVLYYTANEKYKMYEKKIDTEERNKLNTEILSKYKNNLEKMNDDEELFFDMHTMQYFYANRDELYKAVDYINSLMENNNFVSVSEFYNFLNVSTPKGTSYQYWSDDYDDKLELMMTDTTFDGLECTIISFNIEPDIV